MNMIAFHRRSARRHVQRGLTLIELMVGLTLGLVVTAALLLLFANASSNGQNLARSSLQIENGRYVSELLREELGMAGFFGETSMTAAAWSTPDPCSTAPTGWSGAPYTLPAPVQGYAGGDVLACLTNRKPGTDAIAIRRVGSASVDPTTLSAANTQYYVQYSFCIDDIATPRLIFSPDKALFTLRNRACTGANIVRPLVTRIYYVATCNRCNGDDTPTLKRVDLVGNQLVTTAIADGIDELRLEYGFDTDGNGSTDTYRTTLGVAPDPTASWANVMTVKAHFITRSLDKATGGSALATAQTFALGGIGTVTKASDGYTRRAYSSTIRLINPSSAREN